MRESFLLRHVSRRCAQHTYSSVSLQNRFSHNVRTFLPRHIRPASRYVASRNQESSYYATRSKELQSTVILLLRTCHLNSCQNLQCLLFLAPTFVRVMYSLERSTSCHSASRLLTDFFFSMPWHELFNRYRN